MRGITNSYWGCQLRLSLIISPFLRGGSVKEIDTKLNHIGCGVQKRHPTDWLINAERTHDVE